MSRFRMPTPEELELLAQLRPTSVEAGEPEILSRTAPPATVEVPPPTIEYRVGKSFKPEKFEYEPLTLAQMVNPPVQPPASAPPPKKVPAKPARPAVDVGTAAPGVAARQHESLRAPSPEAQGGNDFYSHPAFKALLSSAQGAQPRDDGFESAQRQGSDMQLMAQLARAGATAGGAIGGTKVDQSAYDALDKQAQQPMRQYGQRQEYAQAQAQSDAGAAENDPNSPESQMARDLLSQMIPGVDRRPWFAQVSAAKAKGMMGPAGRLIDERNAAAKANDDRAFRERAHAENLEARKQSAHDSAQDRALRRQESRESRMDTERMKHELRMSERNVGGYTTDPNNPPTLSSSKEMAKIKIAHDNIQSNLGELRDTFSKHGAENVGGTHYTAMVNARERAIMQLKELERLGVLNGRDYELLAKQLPDPTSLRSRIFNADTLQAFDSAIRDISGRVTNAAKAYKYTPEQAATAQPQESGGPRKQYSKSRNQTRIVHPDGRVEILDGRH